MTTILSLDNVSYAYEGTTKNVLQNMSADFETGLVYTIIGKSGAGKTTLLSLLSGLDVATDGRILVGKASLKKINRDTYRSRHVGVVFQSYNLLTNATALQNIVLSMSISHCPQKNKKAYAYALLKKIGIDRETADRKILKLSGGEQQRVAIARALAHNPAILIADEPTGNLDKETEDDILNIFARLAREEDRCIIIVTHSKRVTAIADVVYRIQDGCLTAENG
ncbi:MAG: ATP-binding cassette domain-containing protein [Coriobacteriales bacterium]|jgi:putative ABC transport system ATP-binding protein|nr:ATP-binding cassette domain-containing protein [Coriobacteriales bacterium]